MINLWEKHIVEITWFTIGCCITSAIIDFSKGWYLGGFSGIVLAVLNFLIWRKVHDSTR